MKKKPQRNPIDLSIVIDMETFQITGDLLLGSRLALWQEAARRIAPHTYEIVLCSNQALEQELPLPEGIRLLVKPQAGYYALKNAGAQVTQGKIIFWGDIDCRPDPDCFVHLLAYFKKHPSALIVGGRSYYDGDDFATRVNSSTSFGYLHGTELLDPGKCYVAHNVAVKRDASLSYFGPYTERYGGDEFMTACYQQAGETLRIVPELIIHHESAAHTFRGLRDRNIREIGRMVFLASPHTPSAWKMFRMVRKMGAFKAKACQMHGAKFGITGKDQWKVRLLFAYYHGINLFSTALLVIFPGLLKKHLQYQFGDLAQCQPVGAPGQEQLKQAAVAIARLRTKLAQKTTAPRSRATARAKVSAT